MHQLDFREPVEIDVRMWQRPFRHHHSRKADRACNRKKPHLLTKEEVRWFFLSKEEKAKLEKKKKRKAASEAGGCETGNRKFER